MRKYYVQFSVCCLLFLILLSVFGEGTEAKTADQLWGDHRDANSNANTAGDNYDNKVDAANEVKTKLAANKKTLSAATKSTLTNLFTAADGYRALTTAYGEARIGK